MTLKMTLGNSSSHSSAATDIIRCGKSLYQSGFIAGSEGNISVRLPDGHILITPAGARKGQLESKEIVTLSSEGNQVPAEVDADASLDNPRPSSESGMHLACYQSRKDVFACVHSHAPHATAYAVAGIKPDCDVLPEVTVFVGDIALTEYAPPGTPAVAKSLLPYLATCNAFLLKNHGLLTIGATLTEALNRHEIVEQYLKILTMAKALGNVDRLEPTEMQRLQELTSG